MTGETLLHAQTAAMYAVERHLYLAADFPCSPKISRVKCIRVLKDLLAQMYGWYAHANWCIPGSCPLLVHEFLDGIQELDAIRHWSADAERFPDSRPENG